MIHVRDLEFRYGEGNFRLRIPSLRVARGDRLALTGPSGSGKTTLLHLIAGILTPEAGSIETGSVQLGGLSDSARRAFRIASVGLVFQEFELLEYLSVRDNILLSYRIQPALRLDRAVEERVADLARRVGIEDKLERFPRRLSQGERQRVALCRAVLPGPPLVLADEPTGNLDPANAGRALDILFDYVAREKATLVTVTHDRDVAGRFDRAVDFRDLAEDAP